MPDDPTQIPSRLDRLPWSRFHWRIVIGLGTVWVLDGLEVTIVGAIAPRLTEPGSGIDLSSADVGTAAALYVAGACIGALLFGQLTDRYGRKKLFMVTLGPLHRRHRRDRLRVRALVLLRLPVPDRHGHRRRVRRDQLGDRRADPGAQPRPVDLAINGSFWVGAADRRPGRAAAARHVDLRRATSAGGWPSAPARSSASAILLVRRHVPESPRWLFIHGREDEAERIVAQIEEEVRRETGRGAAARRGEHDHGPPARRDPVPRARARRRSSATRGARVLGLALFIGQAFLYNAVTFDLGTILHDFFDVELEPRCRTCSSSSRPATSSARCCSAACSTPSGASR